MDTNKLIRSVYKRKPLWDKKNRLYNNREIAKELWIEVCQELELDSSAVETVKKRWNNLRNVFRRECFKINKQYDLESTPCCSCYQNMSFLSSQVRARNPINNCDAFDSQDGIYNGYVTELPSEALMNDEPKTESKRKRKSSEDDTPVFQNFCGDNDFLGNDESDYHFLMSLLPFLKTVPNKRKLAVRTKLQQVFSEEQDRNEQHSKPSYSLNFLKRISDNNASTTLKNSYTVINIEDVRC